MTQQSSFFSFQLPSQTSSSLSFCKPTSSGLSQWLATLPKANTGEYTRLLLRTLSELNQLSVGPDQRLQMLELVRPEILQLVRQLEQQHLLNSVILNERSSKVAKLCLTLLYQLYLGYKRLVTDWQGKKSTSLAIALQRGLFSLYQSLALFYLTYQAVPASLWHELHQQFILARYHDLADQLITDNPPGNLASLTPGQVYSCALLLGCARANQIRQRDIKLLTEALPGWCSLAQLQDTQASDSLFAVALNSNSPPRYKTQLDASTLDRGVGLNTSRLISALRNSSEGRQEIDKQGFSTQLIEQLVQAWSDMAKRDFSRVPGQGQLLVTLGMSAVHFYLSNQLPFEDSLNLPPPPTLPLESLNLEETSDIWSQALDAGPSEGTGSGLDSIDYHAEQDEGPPSGGMLLRDYSELFPVLDVNIVNQSHNGYCLEWPQQAPANLLTGDILALRSNDSPQWAIAVTRWIRQLANNGAQIGVELLAVQATPCGIRLIRSGKPASDYLRALHLPQLSNLDSPAQIITPRVPFRENCSVQINIHGVESLAVLTKLCKQTPSCSLFAYEPSQQQHPTTQPAQAASEPRDPDNPDPFSSLWQVL